MDNPRHASELAPGPPVSHWERPPEAAVRQDRIPLHAVARRCTGRRERKNERNLVIIFAGHASPGPGPCDRSPVLLHAGARRDRASEATAVDAIWRYGYRLGFRMLKLYWFFRRPLHFGAGAALWHEGRVLLVRTSYRDSVSVPAGSIDRGETPLDAALRELVEEVSVALAAPDLAFVGVFEHEGNWIRDRFHLFEARLQRPPAIRIDHREIVWAGFATVEEALAMPLADPVRRYLESGGAG